MTTVLLKPGLHLYAIEKNALESKGAWIEFELGNLGDFKSVGEGVFEFRIDYGPGYRVYFAQFGSAFILLLCGGDKRTQTQDILRAKQYWIDFQNRQHADP